MSYTRLLLWAVATAMVAVDAQTGRAGAIDDVRIFDHCVDLHQVLGDSLEPGRTYTLAADAQRSVRSPSRLPEPPEEPVAPPTKLPALPPEPPALPPHVAAFPPESASSLEKLERALCEEQLEVARRLMATLPNSANAAFVMGMTYLDQGNTVEAVKYLNRSLKLNPRRADAYDHLGRTAVLKGEPEKAVALFRKALERNPKMPGVNFRMARALVHLGRLEEAIPPLKREAEISLQSGESHRLLGEVFLQRKEYEKARESFQRAIAIQPKLAKAHYGLATVYARLGQREKYRQYRESFKKLEVAGDRAGRHWRETYDSLAATRQSVAHSHTIAGRVYRTRGYERQAEELWQRAASIDPNNAVCRAELAALFEQRGRFSDALPLYEKLIEIQPENGVHYLYLGNVNARLSRFEDAENAYEKVIQIVPQRPEGYRALAQLYLQINRTLPEAKRLASKLVELEPIGLNYFILASACDKCGDRAGAMAAIRRAMELDPRNNRYRQMHERIQMRK